MKIQIFQSEKGDCLLLEAADGTRFLCDGGMRPSMRSVVSKELAKLRTKGIKLAYVYVSHIDQDHISGLFGHGASLSHVEAWIEEVSIVKNSFRNFLNAVINYRVHFQVVNSRC